MDEVSALLHARALYDSWLTLSEVLVLIGVFLEVFDSLKDLKKKPARLRYVNKELLEHSRSLDERRQ